MSDTNAGKGVGNGLYESASGTVKYFRNQGSSLQFVVYDTVWHRADNGGVRRMFGTGNNMVLLRLLIDYKL